MNNKTNESKKNNDLVSKVAVGVAGAAIGSVAAVVLSNKDNREKLGKLVSNIQDNLEDEKTNVKNKAVKAMGEVNKNVSDLSNKAGKELNRK